MNNLARFFGHTFQAIFLEFSFEKDFFFNETNLLYATKWLKRSQEISF